MAIIRKIVNFAKKIIAPPAAPSGQRNVGFVFPLSIGSGAKASIAPSAGSNAKTIAGSVVQAAKTGVNYVKRQVSNPFAGVTLKEGLATTGKGLLGGALTGAKATVGIAGARQLLGLDTSIGETLKRSVQGGIGLAASPLAFFGALGSGAIEKGVGSGKEILASFGKPNLTIDYAPKIPTLPSFPTFPDVGDTFINFPEMPVPAFPTLPTASVGGFAPSVSVGAGGLGDNLPLLLLLLGSGAAAAAYVAGRRKKKKYKKKRKH